MQSIFDFIFRFFLAAGTADWLTEKNAKYTALWNSESKIETLLLYLFVLAFQQIENQCEIRWKRKIVEMETHSCGSQQWIGDF